MVTKAFKTLELEKVPPVIILHLNRFSASDKNLGKITRKIKFPTNNLDIKSYVSSSSVQNGTNLVYNLISVSNHNGTMEGGHYTAVCKIHDTDE